MKTLRPLIVGNWKMNGLKAQLVELEAIASLVISLQPNADILICPPATLIDRAVQIVAGRISIGGQNCHTDITGSFTGDISAQMLSDMGASSVIVGHSERRKDHGETDAMVATKAKAAWCEGLFVIVCIGETEKQRGEGIALAACGEQLSRSLPENVPAYATAIAYEPLWAIGSGHIPTNAQIMEMHAHIRDYLNQRFGVAGKMIRILYGGSVVADNAREILALPEVDGALIGGASLEAVEFDAIICAISKDL